MRCFLSSALCCSANLVASQDTIFVYKGGYAKHSTEGTEKCILDKPTDMLVKTVVIDIQHCLVGIVHF